MGCGESQFGVNGEALSFYPHTLRGQQQTGRPSLDYKGHALFFSSHESHCLYNRTDLTGQELKKGNETKSIA